VLATLGLVAIVYGFTLSTQDGWAAANTLLVLGAGVLLLVGFLIVESRVRNPLLPLSVLAHRGRGGAYLVVLLMMAGPFGAYLFISFFLQDLEHYSPMRTGLAFLPLTAGVMVAAGLATQLMTRMPVRFIIGGGLLLGAVGMVLLTQLDVGSSYWTAILPSLLMIGLGMGVVLPPALNLSTADVGPQEIGVASAMFNVSQQAGASLDTALLNTVAASASAGYLATHAGERLVSVNSQVHGYNMATLCSAVILAVAGVAAIALINVRTPKPPVPPAGPAAEPAHEPADHA